ncbi:MAG TPA: TIGR03571 family LLM class oxidoreductase [Burkholderiaceae bacterium]|nr:TIGR03571 family LLM class oxidoreductase [Burkholderiaceae bacterium]
MSFQAFMPATAAPTSDSLFNRAYASVFRPGRITLGLMTPLARASGAMADADAERQLAALADRHGFAALWTREVPLMVPQGEPPQPVPLDDPFLWLAHLAQSTARIALGTAAIVLPLRHPLHVAKSALTLDRLSGGRLMLGLGSGDREAEFAAFGMDAARRGEVFQSSWPLLRAALSPVRNERAPLLESTGGFELMEVPRTRIAMLAIGSARQSLQWIARNADGWASYHRDEPRQQGRIGLWQQALEQQGGGLAKPFIQSLHLVLAAERDAPAQPITLGLRAGRDALTEYLLRMQSIGVAHVILNLGTAARSAHDIVEEIGREVLPRLEQCAS